ncbi:MAG: hypothetical protein V7603_3169 [Micromonosporaceae bacterium]
MARQRAGRRNADETRSEETGVELPAAESEQAAESDGEASGSDGEASGSGADASGSDREASGSEGDASGSEAEASGSDGEAEAFDGEAEGFDDEAEGDEGSGSAAEPGDEEEGEAVAEAVDDVERSAGTDAFWESVHIDLVEIALPKGVGYTLRAYRPDTEITPTDISDREVDAFPERHGPLRPFVEDEKAIVDDYDEDEDEAETPKGRRRRGDDEDDEDDDIIDGDVLDEDETGEDEIGEDDTGEDETGEDETGDEDGDDEESGEDDEADSDAAQPEEVPVFLGGRGKLYLFRSPEGLVEFVRSGAEHDLSQLSAWPDVVERVTVADVVPLPEDRYELDLVVENLRGGYDAWDAQLLIQAGEIARDLGYALRLQSVQESLAPGSPLDDLDEVMRTTESGGISGFFARRKLKKIGAEAAPLSWRTIIGKISAAVDWRD